MAPSFDEKVEALRRLREKRQARAAAEAANAKQATANIADGVDTDETAAAKVTERPAAQVAWAAPADTAIEHSAGDVRICSRGGGDVTAGGTQRQAVDVEARTETAPRGSEETDRKQVSGLFAALTGAPSGDKSRPDPAGPGGEGEFDAFFMSGHCHERGIHGCEKDEAKAAEYYTIAAEADHVDAQWRLAELYEFGRGVEQNDAEAIRWYRKAAEAGHMHAQSGLALLLEAGRGCDKIDDEEAFQWHLKAAGRGHALSQYCAACCLEEGRGTPRDVEAAREWLEKSADAGFRPAESKLMETLPHGKCKRTSASAVSDAAAWIANGASSGESCLVDIAAGLAGLLQDLDDVEAERFIDELLADMPEMLDGYGQGGGDLSDDED
eukprot:TRINITY_DN16572_c0_g1_i1.p1 TRINITY_DN16572_c0_g1~~TRINITY_DN16572_c0_g1_i1.p1  ORF type:complete len:407 (-),score=91.37 TRINITY_DN16572_c0_g1_i1:196-1344(-)